MVSSERPLSLGTFSMIVDEQGLPINCGAPKSEEVSQKKPPLKVFINAKGEYYAAENRLSKEDSELLHPAEKLREVLSTHPEVSVDRLVVHEAIIQHGNGVETQYTRTGVSPL